MADVQPFRAVRYARPSSALAATPYDVIDVEKRDALRARDPHNVVHLTLADSEDEAGERYRAWLSDGVLVQESEPAVWAIRQEYLGVDGAPRSRGGVVASLRVEPYESGVVLPHERTYPEARAGRLRLVRAAGAQLEPILVLHEGDAPVVAPAREPDLEAHGTGLWRLEDAAPVTSFFRGRRLLIADGHHRYESALAYADERRTPESARMMVVLVSTSDPGLEILPTHRLFSGRPDLRADGTPAGSVGEALARLRAAPHDRAVAVAYRRGAATLVHGARGELDVQLVDRLGQEGIQYTSDAGDAVGRVDAGEADVAFLLRPLRVEDVFARARRGEVLPPKSTYFFPKLLSGLLFHPV